MKDLQPLRAGSRVLKNLHPYAMKILTDKHMFELTDVQKFITAIDLFLT